MPARALTFIHAITTMSLACGPAWAQELCAVDPAGAVTLPPETRVDSKTGKTIYNTPEKKAYRLADGSTVFLGRFAIDADGHPMAYAPGDGGLDVNASGGHDGDWWAIATREPECPASGTPFTHDLGSPPKPFYVSKTSLENPRVLGKDKCRTQENYVHAGEIPYVALSPLIAQVDYQQNRGRLVSVFDTRAGKRKLGHAMLADQAPKSGYGEGSMALANDMGVPSDPRAGGVTERVFVFVVMNDTHRFPRGAPEVREAGGKAFEAWGGQKRLEACEAQLRALPK